MDDKETSLINLSPRFETLSSYTIIKRDGREEPFYLDKLIKVIKWASETTKNPNIFIEQLLNELSLKIVNKMHIADLYDEAINICVGKISAIQPQWDDIAKYLYLLKIYKEQFRLKRIGSYPSITKFIERGIKKLVYDPKLFESFTTEELDDIDNMIDPNRDLIFNYKGLRLFFDKYCKNSHGKTKTKKVELPQITYMIAAIHSHYNEPHETKEEKKKRLKNIQRTYDFLSNHEVTFATPMISNAGLKNSQFASCVLITVDDDTYSIVHTVGWCALYSKFKGGIAFDVSYIRASGSQILSNNGYSDGPIPFIKMVEQTVSSFNQGGVRSGAVIIYFQWWNWDVFNLLTLKDAGGAEELRARKCKYGMKINQVFLERVKNDEYVTLFDPKETRILNELYGEEFEKKYIEFENNANIRSKKVKAREIMYEFFKARTETGNIYLAHMDNINYQNVTNRFVSMSNLCCEITVPSRPPRIKKETFYTTNKNNKEVITVKIDGEIGLCNLSSINSLKWFNMSSEKKDKLIETLLRGFDNKIDSQYYPVAEAEWPNKAYRPIGIGVTDIANLLASEKLLYSNPESLQFINDLYDDIYYRIYYQSMLLSKEKGFYEGFRESNWAKGLTPYHLSLYRKNNHLGIKFKNDKKWDKLGEKISQVGVRFSLHATLPPSATSGKVTNATEGAEPIMDLFYVETGTHNLPTVVKGRGETRNFYEKCWDIDPKIIINHAIIRQIYIDQSQSWTQYYKKPESVKELFEDVYYACQYGIKTFYYLKTQKIETEEECSSCSS